MKKLFLFIIGLVGFLQAAEQQIAKFDPKKIIEDVRNQDSFLQQARFDIYQFFQCVDRCGVSEHNALYKAYKAINGQVNFKTTNMVQYMLDEMCPRLEEIAKKDHVQKYYAQATTFCAEEPWTLFITNVLKEYKTGLEQEKLLKFPSLTTPYVDLEQKTKDLFEANDGINVKIDQSVVSGFFMAQVLVRYMRNTALEKQKEEFLKSLK